jgi:AcrR family transcriptional regulator
MSGGKARRPAGRQQLDRDVIVTAAIDLAATGETITFRALGSALGTDPTAVYRHFRDKEELMQAVVDRLIVAMLDQLDHDASWRDQLRDGALLSMDIFAAHPRVGIEASAVATGGPGELRAINWILTQLERAGLAKEQIVRFYAAYSSYVLAASAALSQQYLSEDETGRTSRWIGDLRAVDASRLPALAALLPELVALADRDVYVTGIEVFLDSVALAARGEGSGPAS